MSQSFFMKVLVRRLSQALFAIIGVLGVVFILIHSSGSPADLLLPQGASPEARQKFIQAYSLDESLPRQFASFMLHAMRGDFGTSFQYGKPAISLIFDRAPATLLLAMTAMVASVIIGLTLGAVSALTRGSLFDAVTAGVVGLCQAVPAFWLGLVLIWIFVVEWKVLPPGGYGHWQNLILPAVSLLPWPTALVTRLTRSGMLEALQGDYIRTAHAKGAGQVRVAVLHGLRNAIMTPLTMLGLTFAYYVGGVVVIEQIFSWPGIGTLILGAVQSRDYPVVLASVSFVAIVFVLVNLAVDIVQAVLDPRIRTAEGW